jgi:RNA polymerase sigma factor (TIGR02999 family)
MSDVTRILSQIERGDPHAADQLLPLVYEELRKLAAAKLAKEKPGQTLQATALVHEAYIRVADTENAQRWNSRGHFFAAAAEAMRRILVENARRKRSGKLGGDRIRVDLRGIAPATAVPDDDLIALDDAIDKLERLDRVKAQVVKLRFFAGLTVPQTAEAIGVSASTVDNYWTYARAWLRVELSSGEVGPGDGPEPKKTGKPLG